MGGKQLKRQKGASTKAKNDTSEIVHCNKSNPNQLCGFVTKELGNRRLFVRAFCPENPRVFLSQTFMAHIPGKMRRGL